MTLLDARQYDPAGERRRRMSILVAVVLALVFAWAVYHFRAYPERAVVNHFFSALQKQDFEGAYAVWFNDPAWKQNPAKYTNYKYADFYRDWGPTGEWGQVKSYSVDCSLSPGTSGVIVQVTVNSRAQHAFVWVQKSDKTLSFSPTEIECGNWWTWVTE